MALALAEAGADLALLARSRGDLEETAAAAKDLGRSALVRPADIANAAEVEAAVGDVLDGLGRIDVLVNNSGIALVKPLVETTLEEWRATPASNLSRAIGLGPGARRAMSAPQGRYARQYPSAPCGHRLRGSPASTASQGC